MTDITNLINSLKKGYQTSGNAPVSIQVDKDTDIQSRTVVEQTFLEYLELKNRTRNVKGNDVVFYKESGGSDASFIAEVGNIPEYDAKNLTAVTKETKTLVVPMKVSMKAQDGTNDINLREWIIKDSYVQLNNLMDETVIKGDSTTDTNSFDSVFKEVTTISNGGDTITERAIKEGIQACIQSGGHPDCLLCNAGVANQIDELVSPYIRYNNITEIALGHTVSTFKSTDGSFIPILVDNNMPEGELAITDTAGIDVAYQRRPSIIQFAQTNLATNEAIYSWATAYNKAPFKSRIINNIGDD